MRVHAKAASLAVAVLTAAAVFAPVRAFAEPDPKPPLSITYVARVCDRYDQVMANKARNNLQESLQDLGPDSNYAGTDAVSVAKEQAGTPAPPCRPLTDWTFATGTSFTGRTEATQFLSTVTGLLRQDMTTQASTPELDAQGLPTGRTIEGAVTVPLNSAEQNAAAGNHLWVQGGTPSAPLNGKQEQYGFAALRCAQDALNGDNVETVTFPANARHVFCYYYAVSPPPTAGQITVVKKVTPNSNGQGTFRFDGNISYADTNGDGVNDFVLTASPTHSASETFIRGATPAGGTPWSFQEVAQPDGSGWQPPSAPTCDAVASGGGPGKSQITKDSSGKVSVVLAAGDHVTCTYTNSRSLSGGLLEKVSEGGTGTFDIQVNTPPGAPPIHLNPVTTTQAGVPVTVISTPSATPGTYTLTEDIPAPDATGRWTKPTLSCNGDDVPVGVLPPTESAPHGQWQGSYTDNGPRAIECVITNHFAPGGVIHIRKITYGGVGTFRYVVTQYPADRATGPDGTVTHDSTATTTTEGVPATAHPAGTDKPAASGLIVDPDIRYTVQELLPAPTTEGQWTPVSADCGDPAHHLQPETASIEVRLSTEMPTPTCTFKNRFVLNSTLDITKTTSGDTGLRPGPAVLKLTCEDGTTATLTLAPGQTSGAFPRQYFTGPTTCTLTERRTGAAHGVQVHTTAVLNTGGPTSRPIEPGKAYTIPQGVSAVVSVTNTLTRPTPTPPPPPGPPTPPHKRPAPHVPPHLPTLPRTGMDLSAAGLAVAMLVLGAGLVVAGRRRTRSSSQR